MGDDDWRAKCAAVTEQLAALEAEFSEFQDSSKELEKELEQDLAQSTARQKDLARRLEAAELALEAEARKAAALRLDAVKLQERLTQANEDNEAAALRMRELEQHNDDLQRRNRVLEASLIDMQQKLEKALEEAVIVTTERDAAAVAHQEELFRLREHLQLSQQDELALLSKELTSRPLTTPTTAGATAPTSTVAAAAAATTATATAATAHTAVASAAPATQAPAGSAAPPTPVATAASAVATPVRPTPAASTPTSPPGIAAGSAPTSPPTAASGVPVVVRSPRGSTSSWGASPMVRPSTAPLSRIAVAVRPSSLQANGTAALAAEPGVGGSSALPPSRLLLQLDEMVAMVQGLEERLCTQRERRQSQRSSTHLALSLIHI